jgi:hypothetical protein
MKRLKHVNLLNTKEKKTKQASSTFRGKKKKKRGVQVNILTTFIQRKQGYLFHFIFFLNWTAIQFSSSISVAFCNYVDESLSPIGVMIKRSFTQVTIHFQMMVDYLKAPSSQEATTTTSDVSSPTPTIEHPLVEVRLFPLPYFIPCVDT